jgi:hypothetical protein
MKKHLLAFAVAALAAGGALAQANDTIAKVRASGAVTMGVRDSSGALSYTLGDGRYAGYHVEICQRIVANLEKAVGKKVEVKYQPVTSQNRIPLVQNGTVDIECGSTTNNATRQKDVSFALTTYVEEVRIAVKANSGIDSLAKLNGKNVATTTGTTSVQLLRKHERANGIDFKEVFGKDHADSFLLLESGRPHRRRDHQRRADRHHAAQGRPGLQEAGRRHHPRHGQERRAAKDLRQVVRAAHPAEEHARRPAGERCHQGGLGHSQRQAAGRVPEEVILPGVQVAKPHPGPCPGGVSALRLAGARRAIKN